jgi:hypothetical protein
LIALTEEMLMMRPQPRSTMPSMTCRVTLNTLFRFVLMTAFQSPSVMRLKTESRVMPALLTRMSIGPTDRAHVVEHLGARLELGNVAFRGVRLEPFLAHRREPLFLAVVFRQASRHDRVAHAPSRRQIAVPIPPMPPVTNTTRRGATPGSASSSFTRCINWIVIRRSP